MQRSRFMEAEIVACLKNMISGRVVRCGSFVGGSRCTRRRLTGGAASAEFSRSTR